MDRREQNWRPLGMAAGLGLVTLAAYWPALRCGFIKLDDNLYVYDNPHVLGGFSWQNLVWAFTTGHATNWHPVTWLSHMLDAQLFGLQPAWHHLVNVVFHVANTILLFFLLLRLTATKWRAENGQQKSETAAGEPRGTPGLASNPQAPRPIDPAQAAPLVWRCAFVAALFGLHPLHVESVAWVSERKDVLSTFFFLLTLWAYTTFARRREAYSNDEIRTTKTERSPKLELPMPPPSKMARTASTASFGIRHSFGIGQSATASTRAGDVLPEAPATAAESDEMRNPESEAGPEASLGMGYAKLLRPSPFVTAYILSLSFFTCGLLSKPMLVTTPFVLLLLDYWPLGRMSLAGPGATFRALRPLLIEKLPFFLLALLSCVATVEAQAGGHAITLGLPLSLRLANAVVSYLKYLGKTVWPTPLAILYPHPSLGYFLPHPSPGHPASEQWPLWQVGAATAVLALISWLAWLRRERQPWLAFGWCWFLGTLVPVIGLVQVGLQGMADRYTYIPLIGLFIIFVWGAAGGLGASSLGRGILAVAGASVLAACLVMTHRQLGYWRSNFTLFSHALEVTKNNAMAECDLGFEFLERAKYGMATTYFRSALASDPSLGEADLGLALTYEQMGQDEKAVEEFKAGLRLRPWKAGSHVDLGRLLWKLGKKEEALGHYLAAIQLDPDNAIPHYEAGVAFAEMGDYEVAAGQFARAARLQPNHAQAFSRLGEALLRLGKPAEAQRALAEAERQLTALVRRAPANVETRVNLGGVLLRRGKPDEAESQYREAARLDPKNAEIHFDFGTVLANLGRFDEAAQQFDQAIRLKPDYTAALTQQGRALGAQSKFMEAVTRFREVVRLVPTNTMAQLNLGNALMLAGQTNEAALCFSNALRLEPKLAEKNLEAGKTLAAGRDGPDAQARFRTACWLAPTDAALLNEVAWILATCPEPTVRDGAEAARLARRVCSLTGGKDARYLSTLDAAYAEAGDFSEAIRTAEQARDLANANGQNELARAAESRLELYRKKQPFRQ